MLLLDFHPLVEQDLAESAEWYERQQTGVGSRFLDEARDLFRRLPRDGRLYAVRFADIRRVNLRTFPHGVFYFLTANTVVVLAVTHGHRDSKAELGKRRESYD